MKNQKSFDVSADNEIPNVDTAEIKKFSAGANNKTIQDINAYPWQGFSAEEAPSYAVNVRLNQYELSIIKFFAKEEDRSIQKILRKFLIPALKKAVEAITTKNSQ